MWMQAQSSRHGIPPSPPFMGIFRRYNEWACMMKAYVLEAFEEQIEVLRTVDTQNPEVLKDNGFINDLSSG